MIKVEPLEYSREAEYEQFVLNHPAGMFCYGLTWRDLIRKLMDATPLYAICLEDGHIVGIMPAFLMDGAYGPILNALPFYGCHGEPLVAEGHSDARAHLLQEFLSQAQKHQCVSATIIGNPYTVSKTNWEHEFTPDYTDKRIGQIMALPKAASDDDLLGQFEGRARTAIRKAIKDGVGCRRESDFTVLPRLWSLHKRNMATLGGIAKPYHFYELAADMYRYGQECEIYTAVKDNREIAYLLVFHYGDKTEYFTPCVEADYRSHQPMSLLIFEAMKHAVAKKMRYWNFGGTWKSQDGVYQFKKSWGARDYAYRYFVCVLDKKLTQVTPEQLVLAYPYFYVIPFSRQEQAC